MDTAVDTAALTIPQIFQRQHQATQQPAWNYQERRKRLLQIEEFLRDEKNINALVAAIDRDFRKPEAETLSTELTPLLLTLKHIKKHLRRWMRHKRVQTPLIPLVGTRSYIHYEPKGVSLIIAPWNYPFQLAIGPLLYAIAAGNRIVLKPSEISAHTSAFIRQMIESLFPPEEIAVVEGDAEVAKELLKQPFHHIYFTGSPKVGKIIMQSAANHLASVTLELGGKSPAIIDDTIPIEHFTEKTLWGKCINAGQTCIAPDYAIVHADREQAFVENYRKAAQRFYGDVSTSADFARIISDQHFERLVGMLKDATDKGAEIVFGGQTDASERFIAPTLLTGVTDDMRVMQEEIFGPILPVVTYRQPDDIVAIVNARPRPLTFYIGTKNRTLSEYLLQRTSAGGTMINEYLLGYVNPYLPFGGVNNSGIGKSNGHHSFIEFSNERGVLKRNFANSKLFFPPYGERITNGLRRLINWL